MNKIEFNSKICTTKEQSNKLLELGISKETADMLILPLPNGKELIIQNFADESGNLYYKIKGKQWESSPAWSLHRLIEMLPNVISLAKGDLRYKTLLSDSVHYVTMYNDDDKEIPFNRGEFTLYDNIIDCIEWLIKEGYFNKDYLR